MTVDALDPRSAEALAGLLDRATPQPGEPLPLMWHVVLHQPLPAQEQLAPDGHPVVGFPVPPAPGLRRRYAGGRVHLHDGGPTVGATLVADSAVHSERTTSGRGGQLHFVTVRTTLREDGRVVLVEDRDVVYLPPARSGRARGEAEGRLPDRGSPELHDPPAKSVDVDPRLLFRFSALTYNAHRIHYDLEWSREVEGYDGLVVHGPLQAVLMAEVGSSRLGRPARSFHYRLESVLLAHEGLHVICEEATEAGEPTGIDLRVVDDTGRIASRARLR